MTKISSSRLTEQKIMEYQWCRPDTRALLTGARMSSKSRLGFIVVVAAGSVMSVLGAPIPAHAATGQVVVFSTEFTPLSIYNDPEGCHKLPLASTQLNNQTDRPVRVYLDPFCLTPSITVQPGHGSRVPPVTGSFSVD
ncbi:hypothetical protein [Herbidospora solisilvae]|nr:hypothetical protein [Herbidospora solisilvae]